MDGREDGRGVSPNHPQALRLLLTIMAWRTKRVVRPEANLVILRHFHLGADNLAFIAGNVTAISASRSSGIPHWSTSATRPTFAAIGAGWRLMLHGLATETMLGFLHHETALHAATQG